MGLASRLRNQQDGFAGHCAPLVDFYVVCHCNEYHLRKRTRSNRKGPECVQRGEVPKRRVHLDLVELQRNLLHCYGVQDAGRDRKWDLRVLLRRLLRLQPHLWTVSKLKLEFTSLILTAPAGDAKYDAVTAASPFYTGHCIEDSLNIASPGHASPPEICGVNTAQHMFIPMDTCVTININIGTSAGTRSWQILAIQYEAGNLMAPEGNCLQYHTASSGTFASFAWDFATYGEAQAATTTGIAPYTQFHLANQHYNVCFRREQGKMAICYTPKILGNAINVGATAQPTSAAASFGLGGSSSNNAAAIGATQQTDGVPMVVDGTSATTGVSACQGYTVFAKIAGEGDGRTTGDYLEIPQAFAHTSGAALPTGVSTSLITRVCGNVFSAVEAANVIAVGAAISTDNPGTVCSRTTPFRVGVHMDSMEAMGEGTATEMVANYAAKFDNYFDVAHAPNGWNKNEGHGYSGFYLEYFQTA